VGFVMKNNDIETQAPQSVPEASQDVVFSTIQCIEECEYISEEEKAEVGTLLIKFVDEKPNSKEVSKDFLSELGYSFHKRNYDYIDSDITKDFTPENIAILTYLHTKGVKINLILQDKDIFENNLENISQLSTFSKSWDLDLQNILLFHPEFLSISERERENKIIENREKSLLTSEEIKKIETLEEEIVEKLTPYKHNFKLSSVEHRILSRKETDDLFLIYDKLKKSLHTKAETHNIKERIENILLLYNQRLVVTISKAYCFKIRLMQEMGSNMAFNYQDYEEVLQSGNYGLLNAIRRFDINKNTNFSTYATHYVDGTIKNHNLNSFNMIKIERSLFPDIKKVREYRDKLENKGVANPSFEQIISYCKQNNVVFKNNIEKIKSGWNAQYVLLDLYKPIRGDQRDEEEKIDMIASKGPTPEEALSQKESTQELINLFSQLEERERVIFLNRKDFTTTEKQLLTTLGELFGIRGERVRQIEKNVGEKLRSKLEEVYST
jgi:RNA polymerase sigma factor (sigma-70 family)